MAEKAELSADETDRIRDQVQSYRSQDFTSDAAVIAIANHKASRASEKRALAVRRTCLQSNWHRDSATDQPAGAERDHQSELIKQSDPFPFKSARSCTAITNRWVNRVVSGQTLPASATSHPIISFDN
jgi:hypothetical protein